MPSKKKKFNARFPPARIKKIMQTDEDVGKVAAAVPVIISRALEKFIESLIVKSSDITKSKHAKTLSTAHIKQTILSESRFDFLKDLVASIPDIQQGEEEGADEAPTPASNVCTPSTSSDPSQPGPKPRGRPRKKKAEDEPMKPRAKRRKKQQPEVHFESESLVETKYDREAEETDSATEEPISDGDEDEDEDEEGHDDDDEDDEDEDDSDTDTNNHQSIDSKTTQHVAQSMKTEQTTHEEKLCSQPMSGLSSDHSSLQLGQGPELIKTEIKTECDSLSIDQTTGSGLQGLDLRTNLSSERTAIKSEPNKVTSDMKYSEANFTQTFPKHNELENVQKLHRNIGQHQPICDIPPVQQANMATSYHNVRSDPDTGETIKSAKSQRNKSFMNQHNLHEGRVDDQNNKFTVKDTNMENMRDVESSAINNQHRPVQSTASPGPKTSPAPQDYPKYPPEAMPPFANPYAMFAHMQGMRPPYFPHPGMMPHMAQFPSMDPRLPGFDPSKIPGFDPSKIPGLDPSKIPGLDPSKIPGLDPTKVPDFDPNRMPGLDHSQMPGFDPNRMPMSPFPHGMMPFPPMSMPMPMMNPAMAAMMQPYHPMIDPRFRVPDVNSMPNPTVTSSSHNANIQPPPAHTKSTLHKHPDKHQS